MNNYLLPRLQKLCICDDSLITNEKCVSRYFNGIYFSSLKISEFLICGLQSNFMQMKEIFRNLVKENAYKFQISDRYNFYYC